MLLKRDVSYGGETVKVCNKCRNNGACVENRFIYKNTLPLWEFFNGSTKIGWYPREGPCLYMIYFVCGQGLFCLGT